MMSARTIAVSILGLTLAACATAPQHSAPGGAFSNALRVCPGSVANAPGADRNRSVVDYEPYVTLSGVTLARAPVKGCVSSGFGPRRGGAGSYHYGLDIFTRTPAPVYAGGDGVVELVRTKRGYGRTILIRHNRSVKTLYAHLSSYARGLKPGDRVRKGEMIGYTGDTGNATAMHLHYEIQLNGRPANPLSVGR